MLCSSAGWVGRRFLETCSWFLHPLLLNTPLAERTCFLRLGHFFFTRSRCSTRFTQTAQERPTAIGYTCTEAITRLLQCTQGKISAGGGRGKPFHPASVLLAAPSHAQGTAKKARKKNAASHAPSWKHDDDQDQRWAHDLWSCGLGGRLLRSKRVSFPTTFFTVAHEIQLPESETV